MECTCEPYCSVVSAKFLGKGGNGRKLMAPMFEVIKDQLVNVSEKLTHMRRFL
jgi:hypothetical protein